MPIIKKPKGHNEVPGNPVNRQGMKFAIQKIVEQMNVQAMINDCSLCRGYIAELDDLSQVTSIKLLHDTDSDSWHIVVHRKETK